MPRQNTSKISPIKPKTNITVPNQTSPIILKNNNTLFGSIKEGFGFGIGSAIARNMFGNTSEKVYPTNNCIEYNKCMESNDKYECFGNLDKNEYINCRVG